MEYMVCKFQQVSRSVQFALCGEMPEIRCCLQSRASSIDLSPQDSANRPTSEHRSRKDAIDPDVTLDTWIAAEDHDSNGMASLEYNASLPPAFAAVQSSLAGLEPQSLLARAPSSGLQQVNKATAPPQQPSVNDVPAMANGSMQSAVAVSPVANGSSAAASLTASNGTQQAKKSDAARQAAAGSSNGNVTPTGTSDASGTAIQAPIANGSAAHAPAANAVSSGNGAGPRATIFEPKASGGKLPASNAVPQPGVPAPKSFAVPPAAAAAAKPAVAEPRQPSPAGNATVPHKTSQSHPKAGDLPLAAAPVLNRMTSLTFKPTSNAVAVSGSSPAAARSLRSQDSTPGPKASTPSKQSAASRSSGASPVPGRQSPPANLTLQQIRSKEYRTSLSFSQPAVAAKSPLQEGTGRGLRRALTIGHVKEGPKPALAMSSGKTELRPSTKDARGLAAARLKGAASPSPLRASNSSPAKPARPSSLSRARSMNNLASAPVRNSSPAKPAKRSSLLRAQSEKNLAVPVGGAMKRGLSLDQLLPRSGFTSHSPQALLPTIPASQTGEQAPFRPAANGAAAKAKPSPHKMTLPALPTRSSASTDSATSDKHMMAALQRPARGATPTPAQVSQAVDGCVLRAFCPVPAFRTLVRCHCTPFLQNCLLDFDANGISTASCVELPGFLTSPCLTLQETAKSGATQPGRALKCTLSNLVGTPKLTSSSKAPASLKMYSSSTHQPKL